MFATKAGNVRRNSLADFENINRNGKIAMKLDEGDRIVRVAVCAPEDDVLLTTAKGQCIRFQIKEEVRLFKGRGSDGVRGIKLDDGDELISMAILRHVEASSGERELYLKQALAVRRSETAENGEAEPEANGESVDPNASLSAARYAELSANEQFVLTVSERGFGKRSSSYDYRITGRGGKGLVAMIVNDRNGALVASFPVEKSDQIMLVTNAGKLIRVPVDDVRIAARNTQGVRVFKTEDDEKVVSVERIPDDGNGGAENGNGEGNGADEGTDPAGGGETEPSA
jgi:DNA gyrase subunit A